MKDFVASLARTFAPIIAGGVISWLLSLGIEVDAETQAEFIIIVTVLIQGSYYALVRWLEPHLPAWLTRMLLGSAKQPSYAELDRPS